MTKQHVMMIYRVKKIKLHALKRGKWSYARTSHITSGKWGQHTLEKRHGVSQSRCGSGP